MLSLSAIAEVLDRGGGTILILWGPDEAVPIGHSQSPPVHGTTLSLHLGFPEKHKHRIAPHCRVSECPFVAMCR